MIARWRFVWLGIPLFLGFWALAAGCRLTGRHARDPSPEGCAECHQDIVRQWAASAHAAAWSNPLFVWASDGQRQAQCLPCHAPSPLLEQDADQPPKLREENRASGVDCAVCHQTCGAYTGPYRTWGPHPMRQDRTRLACSSFCGTCHVVEAGEHRELYRPSVADSETVRECADCHMPASTSRLTQGHALSYAHAKRVVHDHSFPIWTDELLRGVIEVSDVRIEAPDGEPILAEFRLTNRGAGHCIPTGRFGQRWVWVRVALVDADGVVLDQADWRLDARDGDGLRPNKPAAFSASLNDPRRAVATALRLTVERTSENRDLRHTLLLQQWPMAR